MERRGFLGALAALIAAPSVTKLVADHVIVANPPTGVELEIDPAEQDFWNRAFALSAPERFRGSSTPLIVSDW